MSPEDARFYLSILTVLMIVIGGTLAAAGALGDFKRGKPMMMAIGFPLLGAGFLLGSQLP